MLIRMSLGVVKLITRITFSAIKTGYFCAISRTLFYARFYKALSMLVGFLIKIKIFAEISLLSLALFFFNLFSPTTVKSYNTLINADIFCSFIIVVYYPSPYFVCFKFLGTASPYIPS
jgi:hypothetical protein